MRNVSDKSCRENQNILFIFNKIFLKSCRLWDNVEKYCTAWQTTDDNMAKTRCILDNWGCKHTHRMYNTFCFPLSNFCTNAPQNYVTRELPFWWKNDLIFDCYICRGLLFNSSNRSRLFFKGFSVMLNKIFIYCPCNTPACETYGKTEMDKQLLLLIWFH